MKYSPRCLGLVVVALALAASPLAALSETTDARQQRGAAVMEKLNRGQAQPALERIREEFPFLAEATEAYALGDVWGRPGLDDRTRQLAAVATFAATGQTAYMKIHAGYALNVGASEEELKEIIYLVTVAAGFPQAISASRALSELLAERRSSDDSQ